MYISINPATEEKFAEYPLCSENELSEILNRSSKAQLDWKRVPLSEKLKLVENLSVLLEQHEERTGKIITSEMGKVLKFGRMEVIKQKLFCDHALERTATILSDKDIPNPNVNARIVHEPLGVVFAITPWNFPFGTSLRLSLPALLTGNSVILKPAPNVTGSVLALRELYIEAGFPEDVILVPCLDNALAEKLIGEPLVRKIAFVGSGAVGARLASIAGLHAKPILLELGGSDPFLVLKDADIELASSDATTARCSNSGQVCCSSKRFIVEEPVYEEFLEKFKNKMSALKVGDPLDNENNFGPLARKDIRDKLVGQVSLAKKNGAKVILDGGAMPGKGFYFSPMILEESGDVGTSTNEEFFGPVASVYKARNREHAVKIANMSNLGLGSAVYSRDLEQANIVAQDLENGFVYINKPPGLNPYLPFGGVKGSGYGKDCGDEGYFEYVNKKVVVG